jgi:hypothetical protein
MGNVQPAVQGFPKVVIHNDLLQELKGVTESRKGDEPQRDKLNSPGLTHLAHEANAHAA